MTEQQAIQEAIKGGWGIYDDVDVHSDGDVYLSVKGTSMFEFVESSTIFTDPLFWSALGKQRGWDMLYDPSGLTNNDNSYVTHALRWFTATMSTPEAVAKFWKELP